jgi:hypothetical protein
MIKISKSSNGQFLVTKQSDSFVTFKRATRELVYLSELFGIMRELKWSDNDIQGAFQVIEECDEFECPGLGRKSDWTAFEKAQERELEVSA